MRDEEHKDATEDQDVEAHTPLKGPAKEPLEESFEPTDESAGDDDVEAHGPVKAPVKGQPNLY